MNLEILTQITLVFGLAAYIWNDAKVRNEKTCVKVEDLEKRVQKIEDVQGNKLDALSADFKEFKHDVNEKLESLKTMVHKDKNQMQQTETVLKLLLDHLTKENNENYK